MKLPIVGDDYTNRQLAAGAQECLNWYRESVEDQNGSGKSTKILRQTPGIHLLRNITTHAGSVRGIWSGAGRCFVCVGAWVYEIDSAGATVGTPSSLILNDTLPVQFAGNGNQLGIVASGYFYLNNGSGFVAAKFKIQGKVTIAAAIVTWVSGEQFPATFGVTVILSGIAYAVLSRDSATQLTLTAAFPGSGTGFCDTFPGPPIGAIGPNGMVTDEPYSTVFARAGSSSFDQGWVGLPITIGGFSYVVKAVINASVLILTTNDSGQQVNAAFSAVQTNIVYEAPAGDLVTAKTLAYMDGQFYVQRPSGGTPDLGRQVNFSAVNDGTDWSGLDFFLKEGAADYIQSIFADREILYVFGQDYASEAWQNDPNTGRPVRMSGAVSPEASACRFGVVSMGEHLYFIGGSPGGNPVAYRVDGFTPTRISTHAVEAAWALKGVAISTAVAWWYIEDGHYFWVICFSSGSSWVYDATEKAWHERTAWDGAAFQPYRPWYHTFIPEWGTNGQHIVGDYNSGKVLIMSSAFYDDEGVNVKRVRILPYIYAGGGKRVYVERVDLDMATGLIPSGAEPTVALDWSLDNGLTFSTPETAGFGLHDATSQRVYWLAQGSGETAMLPRVSITGQAQTVLIDLEAEVYLGDS